MKKQVKLLIIALCLVMVLSVAAFSACAGKITITVKINLGDSTDQTFEVDANAEFYSQLASYLPQNTDGQAFVGWFDANGVEVTSQTRWDKSGTVTAKWTSAFTVTFDKNNPQAEGEMAVQTVSVGETARLAANGFTSSLVFDGWNTQSNGSGDDYSDEAEITPTQNITLYAQWKVTYTEQIYVEKIVNGDSVYEKVNEVTVTNGRLNNIATVQTTYDEPHYYLDETHQDAVISTSSLQNGDVLKAYYSIERLTVTYMDDKTIETAIYNQPYTIRTPKADPESATVVVTYSSDQFGNGREYPFGREVSLTNSIVLYPIYAEVYTDVDESGDRVIIRRDISGMGAATLIIDGVSHLGFVNDQAGELGTFEVAVRQDDQDEEITYNGKLFSDGTFMYRDDQSAGTYFMGDSIFPNEIYSDVMLALDGYGTGVLAALMDDGSGRTQNYYVSYIDSGEGDYYMEYYLPSNPSNINYAYFILVHTEIEGVDESMDIAGYFMFYGEEAGSAFLVYNGEISNEYILSLDGYGNATYNRISQTEVDGELVTKVEFTIKGRYYASPNYTYDEPEYIFEPSEDNDSALTIDAFYFILFVEQNPSSGAYYMFFLIKRGEAGIYTQSEGQAYPELELDGYGVAGYTDSESSDKRLGLYTINSNLEGGFTIAISFTDDVGGTMRVTINQQNKTFAPLEGDFNINGDGVLIEYYGTDSVIVVPEGVTEIADGVFKNVNISTITLPSTLTKIGDYAFQNSSASDKSALKTVYLNAATPPVLGADPFRWVTSEFKIIVPDDSLEAYRQDAGWTTFNGSAIYADYVTSLKEIADKPEFEIKNGVLVSYNNKDDNPQNVAIKIPDTVTEIAANVFEGRVYITSVDLNNVTVIGKSAFDGCINLSSVKFNSQTDSIGDYAFYNCLGLTEVDLGNVQSVGNGAFLLCYNLTKVMVGNRIQSIGSQAFSLCAVVLDEDETVVKQNELVLTITAAVAPTMSSYIFQGSAARIYVDSYEVGLNFANSDTWQLYAIHLRVRAEQSQTMYSLSNMGAELLLGDYVLFDSSRSGLYKWVGNELHIAWFDRDEFTNKLTVIQQVGEYNPSTGLIRGFSLYDNDPLVFVVAGTEVSYSNGAELIVITFGSADAIYNGRNITIEIVNYRMQFTYNGYIYHLSLANDKTFTYTRNKIKTTTTYKAADGSEITVTYGDSITAIGTLKNVDENLSITVTYLTWTLTEGANGTYTWIVQWREKSYQVTATLDDENNTFVYSVAGYSDYITYRNGDDYIVVTSYANGKLNMSFNFKTANGELSCNIDDVQAVAGSDNSYSVTITIMVDIVDEEGNVIGQTPSEFNGDYIVTLNHTDHTYVLTAQN